MATRQRRCLATPFYRKFRCFYGSFTARLHGSYAGVSFSSTPCTFVAHGFALSPSGSRRVIGIGWSSSLQKVPRIAIIKSNQGGWRTATAQMDLDTTVTLRTMEEQRREYVQRALHRFVHGLVGILSSSYSSRQRPRPSLSYVVHKPPHHSAHIKRTGELTTARSYFESRAIRTR
jgi:hypothetical protein